MKTAWLTLLFFMVACVGLSGQSLSAIEDPAVLWEEVRRLDNKPAYNSFVRRFPGDMREEQARQRIIELYRMDKEKWEESQLSLAAAIDPQDAINAYQNYLLANPIGAFTAYRFKANTALDSLARQAQIPALTSRPSGHPGEIKITLSGSEDRLEAEQIIVLERNGVALATSNFLAEGSPLGTGSKSELILKELEGGNYRLNMDIKGSSYEAQFIMPIRDPDVKVRKIDQELVLVIRGVTEPCSAYLQRAENPNWEGPFSLPNNRPIIKQLKEYLPDFDTSVENYIRVVKAENEKLIGEAKIPKEGFSFDAISSGDLDAMWDQFGIWVLLSLSGLTMLISIAKGIF